MKTYTLTVIEKRLETKDAVTIVFKQPGLRKISYLAGQYITLIFNINGRKYLRPYSFSSTPNYDKFLEVTVKRVFKGIVSNYIHDELKVGDVVEILEPNGNFVLPTSEPYCNYILVLWCVGSGITPLFSIIKAALLDSAGNRKIILVYGCKTSEDVIFSSQLDVLKHKFSERLSIYKFYSQQLVDEYSSTIQTGRINSNYILNYLSNEFKINQTLHFICGPSFLKSSVKQELVNYEIPNNQIFTEEFELAKNEADFIDIETQQVIIKFKDIVYNIKVQKGKSILEAGLDAQIDLPYSCQTGNCSICKGKITNGEVKQILPKHSDLNEQEFQLCCTFPKDEKVIVEV